MENKKNIMENKNKIAVRIIIQFGNFWLTEKENLKNFISKIIESGL